MLRKLLGLFFRKRPPARDLDEEGAWANAFTDTATLYVVAPEILAKLSSEDIEEMRTDFDESCDCYTSELDRWISENGGAVFYCGSDGNYEITIPNSQRAVSIRADQLIRRS